MKQRNNAEDIAAGPTSEYKLSYEQPRNSKLKDVQNGRIGVSL
jgi:hypothetical protein